ncbi:hypothetical protein E8E15_000609 [Penicillium rubens]|nr:hypothetical protein E8E15_000609 [Penicillium rubens]
MGNFNDHDPNPQGNPNRNDPSRQIQGHAQWNQLPAQTPLPLLQPTKEQLRDGQRPSLVGTVGAVRSVVRDPKSRRMDGAATV